MPMTHAKPSPYPLNKFVFMAMVDGKVQMVLIDDASDECKTMENLLQRIIKVIKILEKEWYARKLLAHLYPHMITLDCYAHQINLIVSDYFKVNQGFLKYSTLSIELITWLCSKTFLLTLIWEVQKEKGLQSTLKFLVAKDEMLSPKEKRVVTGDVKAQRHANMMLGIINDPLFWHSLARIKVLLTFGLLYMHYTKELSVMDSVEKLVQYALLSSIKKCWEKSDQEVFIAAVVFNPFMKLKPFPCTMRTSFLTIASINDLLSCLYSCFFSDLLDPSELLSNIQDYIYNKGIFSLLPSWADTMAKQSLGQNTSPNLSLIYEDILGNILTKLCNCLGTKTLTSLAEMKMHIHDEQLQQTAKVQERLKHNFRKAKDSTLPSKVPLMPNISEAVEISNGWVDDGDDSVDHTTLDNRGRKSLQTMTEEMSH
ncbi:hypothetical protein EDD85DRAFT_794763 [Armillaria nabsnona]|nr:hypothetical protein EDD85DRAFT_794763 [Armillaria nabsnona]